MMQSIVRATPVGYEEFYVLRERGLFNAAPKLECGTQIVAKRLLARVKFS
jgi:hypothetical protein